MHSLGSSGDVRFINNILVSRRHNCGSAKVKASACDGVKKNQKKFDICEMIQGLHESGSTLAAPSRCLKVQWSCVQTIIHKSLRTPCFMREVVVVFC